LDWVHRGTIGESYIARLEDRHKLAIEPAATDVVCPLEKFEERSGYNGRDEAEQRDRQLETHLVKICE
jgi:hypothetical protein